MKTALIIMLLSVMTMTACSSNNTPKTQYYLLNSPTKAISVEPAMAKSAAEKESTLSITLLELPDYLAQPNLVLQLSNHQLHYSNFHMWAEPLNAGLAQALANDLNTIDKHYNVSVTPEVNSTTPADIVIKITAFQATHQSQVILVGNYTLKSSDLRLKNATKNQAKHFKFAVELSDNGYPHAVEKMRAITLLLAEKISKSITH